MNGLFFDEESLYEISKTLTKKFLERKHKPTLLYLDSCWVEKVAKKA